MSRKDYVEAARILSETAMAGEVRAQLVARFVTMFADDNPRFSPSRFRDACEPELSERDRLEARGFADGRAAATWVEISDETAARWLLDALDAGDPLAYDIIPSPRLGGEYAGEPTWSDILEDEGCEDSDDGRPELLDAYEYAFSCAAEREIVRSCRAQLDLVPHDLGTR